MIPGVVRRGCVSAFFVCAVWAANAGEPGDIQLIPRRILFQDADYSNVKLSPDGNRLSFRMRTNGLMPLFIAPLHQPDKGAPVFEPGPSSNLFSYDWAYTGQHLICIVEESGKQRAIAVDLRTQKAQELSATNATVVRVEKLSLTRSNEVLLAETSPGSKLADYHVVNILTGARTAAFGNEGRSRVFVDGSFNPRAGMRSKNQTVELLYRTTNQTWSIFASARQSPASGDRVTPLAVDNAGEAFYFLDNRGADKAVLKALDLNSGSQTILANDSLADLQPAVGYDPATGKAQSVATYFGDMRRHFIDHSIEADFEFLREQKHDDVGLVGRSMDDKVWLVVLFDGGPWRFFAYERPTRRLSHLFSTHSEAAKYPTAQRRSVTITTRDGLNLPGWLYLPARAELDEKGRPTKPLPMLMCIHGGPGALFQRNDWFVNRMLQLLADRGYAAYFAEFRGTAGLGKAIYDSGRGEWGAKMNTDVIDAAEWAVREGITTRERIGIWGWSYGGYETLAALAFTPGVFACGMDMFGPSDLEWMVRSRPEPLRSHWQSQVGDYTTEAGRALLKSRSPLYFATNIVKPLLITHGAKDPNVPRAESDAVVAAMKEYNRQVTHLVYRNEGHDYELVENYCSLFGIAERFFHEHLGGYFEPYGKDVPSSGLDGAAGAQLIPGLANALKAPTK